MIRKLLMCLVVCAMSLSLCGEAFARKEAQVQAKLDAFVAQYVAKANKNMSMSRAKPKVIKRKGKFVAMFTEIDTTSVRAELRKGRTKHFEYVAALRYHELTYESEGKTRKAALKGQFQPVKVRKLTEMPRYCKGKWEN